MSRRLILLPALALTSALAVSACSGGDDAHELGSAERPVQLGVVGASSEYWSTYEKAVEAEGIELELVDFTEYSVPNPALSSGDLDINQFQHIQYLANYNVDSGDTLQPIGATAIYPLGLYSTKYDSVDAIPDGETVVVPEDAVNQARGLLVLQSAGLVTLTGGGDATSTVQDIDQGASRVKVQTVEGSVTARSLPDVAGAIINNDFLGPAGLADSDAIAKDDPSDPKALPYVNIFVTRADDADNEVLNKLVDIYQTNQDVLDQVQEQSGGTAVFLKTPAADLQQALTDTEAALSK